MAEFDPKATLTAQAPLGWISGTLITAAIKNIDGDIKKNRG